MSNINRPAFPIPTSEQEVGTDGLTKLEYTTIEAMKAVATREDYSRLSFRELAVEAVQLAKATLAALEAEQP